MYIDNKNPNKYKKFLIIKIIWGDLESLFLPSNSLFANNVWKYKMWNKYAEFKTFHLHNKTDISRYFQTHI